MTLSKNKEKFIKSLRLKKFRQKYNNFIVEGDKMARELLGQKPELVIAVFALEEWLSRVEEAADVAAEKLFPVSGAALRRISGLDTPNQVLVVSSIPNTGIAAGQVENSLSLYLDGIQDPGNFGAILRIADWFGIGCVFTSAGCVDPYNPKVVQASMGSLLRVACAEASLEALHREYPALPVYGAVMDGENIFKAGLDKAKGIIVIGNEGRGLSPEAERFLSHRISIPRAAQSRAESLNAAIAAGILCAVFTNMH